MKATIFAVILSLCVFSVHTHASVRFFGNTTPSPTASIDKKINLNRANAQMLMHAVPGIGKKRAESIVKYREAHGLFKSVEDLAKVRGLGKQFVKRHRVKLMETFTV